MSDRNHPVRGLLDVVALGHRPTAKDIDELRLAPDVDRAAIEKRIREATKLIHGERQGGFLARARQLAAEHAAEVIGIVGEPMPEQRELPVDPRGLARLIPRH